MSSAADVRSFAQMQVLRDRCESTRVKLLRELENLHVELRKMTIWLESEVESYWMTEHKKASRVWREAKEVLTRCESYVRESEKRPCTEQRKQLAKATERLQLCERQLNLVREAQRVWERNSTKLLGQIQRALDMADSEIPVAINRLDGFLGLLETYSQIRAKPSDGA